MSDNKVREIQLALVRRGFVTGEVDGIWGRRTIQAVRAFQQAAGLSPDGIVGPITHAALFGIKPDTAMAPLLPWMAEADNLSGTEEVLGSGNNPVILDWAKDLDIRYPGDDVPWCGLFVAHCIGATMPGEVLPTNPLGARAWAVFGDATEPRVGAVLVFWRESPSSGKGHVGFYTGENRNAYRILGGNQSNKVGLALIGKDRLLKARWPRTAASLNGGVALVMVDKQGVLSQNEA